MTPGPPPSDPEGDAGVRVLRDGDPAGTRDDRTPQQDGDRPVVARLAVVPSPARSSENDAPEVDPLAGKHVLLVGIHYAPEMAGIAPHTTALARSLAARAERVTVLTGVPHHPPGFMPSIYRRTRRTHARDGEVQVVRHRHPVPRRREGIGWLRYETGFVRAAMRTRLPGPPDVVIGVTPSAGSAVVARRLAGRFGVPLVLVVQNVLRADRSRHGPVPWAVDRWEGRALRAADRVVVVDDRLRDPVLSHGVAAERVLTVPNPSRRRPWERMTASDARERMGWDTGGRIALHAGNLGVAQDVATIVAAARILAARGDRTRIVLAGDGSQRRLHEDAARRELPLLQFVDPVSAADYPSLLAAADVLLLTERPGAVEVGPSTLSRLGSHLRACRPVIAALDPGGEAARRAAALGDAVLRIPPGDPAALADAVHDLCGSATELDRRGRAARALADAERRVHRDGSERLISVIADVLGVSTGSAPAGG